jgi:hypothetical protein
MSLSRVRYETDALSLLCSFCPYAPPLPTTGLWPYHDLFDEHAIQNATMAGIKPALHPAYRYRSFIERRLTEIMDRCHVLEPADRVDIFTVVQHLRETKRLSQLREHQTQ